MELKIAAGFTKKILDQKSDKILSKFKDFTKDQWEKFKIQFDEVYVDYLKKAFDKYCKIKTILCRSEPQFIYDFFVYPYVRKLDNSYAILLDSVNKVLEISHFIIVRGTGGIGKSTLLKHLFVDEISNGDLIPVFVELKDINDLDDDYSIEELVFNQLHGLGSTIKPEYIDYALKTGSFVFFFDGLDEILSSKEESFKKKLIAFCDYYSANYYVVTSRPNSDFLELQKFTILETLPFTKKQALDFVNHIDFDSEIKAKFLTELDDKLFDNHYSFASNPLLLSIMLLTYESGAEIPSKLHLFYSRAFDTLFNQHDATKTGGYKREKLSLLPYDDFKKVFSQFCYISYVKNIYEFSQENLLEFLKPISKKNGDFDLEKYIKDLVNALCLLYKEGFCYRFTHRSFQEYFCALFLKELSDKDMYEVSRKIIEKDARRSILDSVFRLLKEMNRDRFNDIILLPLMKEIEEEAEEDILDYYLDEVVSSIAFMPDERVKNSEDFLMGYSRHDCVATFVIDHAIDEIIETDAEISDTQFMRAVNEKGMVNSEDDDMNIPFFVLRQDKAIYKLFKKTWIGKRFKRAIDHRMTLEQDKKTRSDDLLEYLNF